MATTPQPAKKSYFFGKGYVDLGNTIKGAWQRNFNSIGKYKDHIADSHNMGDGKVAFIFKLILNILAMISVLVFGSIITLVISAINIKDIMILLRNI